MWAMHPEEKKTSRRSNVFALLSGRPAHVDCGCLHRKESGECSSVRLRTLGATPSLPWCRAACWCGSAGAGLRVIVSQEVESLTGRPSSIDRGPSGGHEHTHMRTHGCRRGKGRRGLLEEESSHSTSTVLKTSKRSYANQGTGIYVLSRQPRGMTRAVVVHPPRHRHRHHRLPRSDREVAESCGNAYDWAGHLEHQVPAAAAPRSRELLGATWPTFSRSVAVRAAVPQRR